LKILTFLDNGLFGTDTRKLELTVLLGLPLRVVFN